MEALEKVKAELVPIGKPVPNSNQPGFVSKNGPVKTNAAFILRADSVLQKHREKEVAAIENFESGLRDRYGLGAFPNPASLFAHTRTRRDVLPLLGRLTSALTVCAYIAIYKTDTFFYSS